MSVFAVLALGFWDNALAAADLEALLVRPSRSVFEAAVAALDEVCFAGAFLWDSALPAADFDFDPTDLPFNVFEALDAAFFPVTFLLAMFISCSHLSA